MDTFSASFVAGLLNVKAACADTVRDLRAEAADEQAMAADSAPSGGGYDADAATVRLDRAIEEMQAVKELWWKARQATLKG